MSNRPAISTEPSNKLLGLEVIRFICAFGVLIWHYQHFSFVAGVLTDFSREQQPFYWALRLFYDYGLYGVQVFWCISGFIFFWKYRAAVADKVVGGGRFFILRFSRLYPLHIVTLLLAAGLQFAYLSDNGFFFVYQNNNLGHFALQLFLASNWYSDADLTFNAPIWSVSIEVLVYVFFFLTLRLFGKSVFVIFVVLALCAAAKIAIVPSPIVNCASFFYIGGLSAVAFQYFSRTKWGSTLWVLSLMLSVSIPFVAYYMDAQDFQRFEGLSRFDYLFMMIYTPILLYCAARDVAVRPGVQRAIEAAGNMTYSSYLLHFPLQMVIALCFGYVHSSIPVRNAGFFLMYLALTLVASYLVYRYFERPAQDAIRKRCVVPSEARRLLSTESA